MLETTLHYQPAAQAGLNFGNGRYIPNPSHTSASTPAPALRMPRGPSCTDGRSRGPADPPGSRRLEATECSVAPC